MRAVGARKIPDQRDPLLAYINATSLSQKLTYEYEDRYACMHMHTYKRYASVKADS